MHNKLLRLEFSYLVAAHSMTVEEANLFILFTAHVIHTLICLNISDL